MCNPTSELDLKWFRQWQEMPILRCQFYIPYQLFHIYNIFIKKRLGKVQFKHDLHYRKAHVWILLTKPHSSGFAIALAVKVITPSHHPIVWWPWGCIYSKWVEQLNVGGAIDQLWYNTIVKPKQAGTCGRSTKYHPRCQISIYVQFSLWWKVILHIILKVNKLNMFYSILYNYRLVILTYAHFLCSAHKCQLVLVLL